MKEFSLLLCITFLSHFTTSAQPNFLHTEASWSPDGRQIVFISKRDGNNEVYIMNSDGSNQQRLTNTQQSESQPSWSPNGENILFHSERTGVSQIFIMNSDGSNQSNLTKTNIPEYQAEWSPNGDKIAFTSVRDKNSQVYIMNPDGTNQQRVVHTTTNLSSPTWSPDGEEIAFMCLDIWKRKIDYIKYNFSDDSSSSIFGDIEQPHQLFDWSKDDKFLFTKNKIYSSTESTSEIYLANSDMTDSQKQSKNISQLITAKLSPQGDKILYTSNKQVFVLTIGEKKPIKVGKKHHSAKWSPDGESILMVSSNVMNIYTVKSDGTDLRQLTFKK